MSVEANATGSDPASGTPRVTRREQLHGARYGEVLLVRGRLNRIEATVYNTLGLNDCPDDLWQALDAEVIKKAHHARAAILNGPRYFLMDSIAIADPGTEIVTFGDLQMRPLATVHLSLTDLRGGLDRQPYTERAIRRSTIYEYDQGREVYELVAPDGTTNRFRKSSDLTMGGVPHFFEEPAHVFSPLERRAHVASTGLHCRAPPRTAVCPKRQTPLFEPAVAPRDPAGAAFRLPVAGS